MKYARYISETRIDTSIPKKGYDAQGNLVIGNLLNRPDVLALLRVYPLTEEPHQDPQEGYHLEARYREGDNSVVMYYVEVENPPAPPEPVKVYSKLKILIAADEAGFADQLMDMIESDRKTKYIWDASNTIEDNELLATYLPSVAEAIGKTEEEVKAFLDEHCVAD